EAVSKDQQKFLGFCILDIFDINKMFETDLLFLQNLLRCLFICLKHNFEKPYMQENSSIYKNLALAFVLRKAESIFTKKHQMKQAMKYKQLSLHYEEIATERLELIREESFTTAQDMLNSNVNKPDWCTRGLLEVAYLGRLTRFMSHRV
ncbi:hypothetical protein PMAYCL1PPCAC_03317, partial [Pristionchus mayeri]